MGKIGRKIFKYEITILIISLLITVLLFTVLSNKYLTFKAKKELLEEYAKIEKIIDKRVSGNINKIKVSQNEFKAARRFIQSNIVVISNNRKIVYRSIQDMTVKELKDAAMNNGTSKNTVVIKKEIRDKKGNRIGMAILGAKMEDLRRMIRLMTISLLVSMTISIMVATIVGKKLEKSITRPLTNLTNRVKNFSIKDKEKYDPIKTGDEIERLDEGFREMANRIYAYDTKRESFMQNASHELKTPLMSIRGYAEAIKDGVVEGEELDKSLDIIIDESIRLTDIVNEILYITKIENKDEDFVFEQRDVIHIVNRAIDNLKFMAKDKNIDITFEYEDKIMRNVDEEKLLRVFINIIGNSIRYAKNNITIKVVENKDLRILIMDDGIGIKAGEENKIFERFYKSTGGKTGLGLYIGKVIINRHKGNIIAYNNESGGATFEINLPES
ncbi:sensor histidine kinase [Anaeromicrobium sediminis]|uniref:histidine kinase n=1 Tax=Anaeromicrobium sediminis TaxID=1478221 RepID=A0A267MH77_9FIRM|nr:HAMP domain-containing sensor histidine kinase [Anaeromicrobium sediminis]PAB58160.1 hypothetical protein CCE28_16940 [Anaeromicrobium sediminis]